MDLVKSWVIAILAFVLGAALTVFIAEAAKIDPARLSGGGSGIAWNLLSALLIYFFVAGLSGLVHSRPHRDNPTRYALAALLIPAVLVVLTLIFGLVRGTPPLNLIADIVGSVAGAGLGFLLARRLRKRSSDASAGVADGSGYF